MKKQHFKSYLVKAVRQAEALLKKKINLSIQEISNLLGYADISHFHVLLKMDKYDAK
jgi:YesN/AraC family two-component response regulator